MALIDEIKVSLRISVGNTAYDSSEIQPLIDTAKADLVLAGVTSVKANDETDPLIKRAISLYCKANFGFDNPDSEKLQRSYDLLKASLTLAGDYTDVV